MNFLKRLVALRKTQGFSQLRLADAVAMNVNQINKYEAGRPQPTLTAMINWPRPCT